MALRLAKPGYSRVVNACISSVIPTKATKCSTNGVTDSLAQEVPPGCSRYTVKLTKPMGLVLQQDTKTLAITIADIKPDGSAAKAPERMCVGDQLIATSGVTYDREADYGVMVKMGQKVVRLMVQGETFKTVSAAIGSHPGHIPVTLEFQRCEPAKQ
ncbi:hypothetical protein V8C86DRAFT_2513596 [Haematococcus lacustris]